MHTAICTFENPADADRAVDRLLQSGFDRGDIHMEHRHADGSPIHGDEVGGTSAAGGHLMHGEPAAPGQANDQWDGLEREVAMDSGVVRRLGNFFERLFGADEGIDGRAATYHSAIERGHCVVIVEAGSDEDAERAQNVLHGMNPSDVSLFERVGQRPLRELVAERQAASGAGSMEQRFGTARADMGGSHDRDLRGEGEFPRSASGTGEQHAPERAMASMGWGEQRRLELADEDQPIASPDLRRGTDVDDKPR